MDHPKSSQSDYLSDYTIKGRGVRAKKCSRKVRGIENGEEKGTRVLGLISRRGVSKAKV
jgi:hypothetical protein